MFRRHHLDDAAIDRILSGRPVAGENELVSFIEDVHIATIGTPVPSAALLTVFSKGLSHVKGDLSATAASNVTGPELQAAGLPQRRKRNMLEIALAKLGTMALAAKLGVAAGAVTLAGAAAAATGTLPAPVQDFAADTASRAGIEIPASEGRQDAERRQDGDTVKPEDDSTEEEGTENYGDTVSGGAQELEPGEGREFGETTATNTPKAEQAPATRPTAEDNPGTTARSEAPAPGTRPTAEDNSGTTARSEAPAPAGPPADATSADAGDDEADAADADAESAPEETPSADSNPGSGRRP